MESTGELKEKVRLIHVLKTELEKKKSKLKAYESKKLHVRQVISQQNKSMSDESENALHTARNSSVVTFAPETQIVECSNEVLLTRNGKSSSDSNIAQDNDSDLNLLFDSDVSFFEDQLLAENNDDASFDIFSEDVKIREPLTSSPKYNESINGNMIEDEDMFHQSAADDVSIETQSNISTSVLCFKTEEFNQSGMFSIPSMQIAKLAVDIDQSKDVPYLAISTEKYLYLYKMSHELSHLELIWRRTIFGIDNIILTHEKVATTIGPDEVGFLRLIVVELQADMIVLFNCYVFYEESLVNCLTVCLHNSHISQTNFSCGLIMNNECLTYCLSDSTSIIVNMKLPQKKHPEFRKLFSSELNFIIVNILRVDNASDLLILQDLHHNMVLIRIDTKNGNILSKFTYKLISIDRMALASAFSWHCDFVIVSLFVQCAKTGISKAQLIAIQNKSELLIMKEDQPVKPIVISEIEFIRPLIFDVLSHVVCVSPSVCLIVENKELHCRILDWTEKSYSIISLSVTEEIISAAMWTKGYSDSLINNSHSFVLLGFESADIVIIKFK